MKQVSHKELKSLLKTIYDKKLPLYLHGTFGIGKSRVIGEEAKKIGGFVDVRVSQLEASDFRGIPKFEGSVTKWMPPSWLPTEGKGVLFLDEINLAPPSVMAAAYELILDRRIGDYRLPDGWIVAAAGNLTSDRANVFDLPSPLANRFLHLELKIPSVEEWTDWAMENGNKIDSRIIAFLHFKPSRMHSFDASYKDKAVATPRTWEMSSKLMDGVEDDETMQTLVASAVGEAVAIELLGFLRIGRKINVKELLENPKKVKEIKELDLKYSILSTVAEHYKKEKGVPVLKKILVLCSHMEAEFAVLLLRMMKATDTTFFAKEVMKLDEWHELATDRAKYLL